MKQVLLSAIAVYQRVINPLLHQLLGTKNICRNNPTCSTYAKGAIMEYGAAKGFVLSFKRILNCQPYFSI